MTSLPTCQRSAWIFIAEAARPPGVDRSTLDPWSESHGRWRHSQHRAR